MGVSEQTFLQAAFDGDIKTVRSFLEDGGNINCESSEGRTALHKAAIQGNSGIVHLLLDYGADKTLRDKYGDTPENDARRTGQTEIIDILRHYQPRPPLGDGWHLLAPDRIAHVQTEELLKHRVTEIFNFATQQYQVLTQNKETNAEALFVSSFQKLGNNRLIDIARDELHNQGGKIKPDDLEGAMPRNKRPFPDSKGGT